VSVKKDFIVPVLVLSLICIVVSGALAVMNGLTHPIIEAAAAERAEAAMNAIIPDAAGFVELGNEGLPDSIREAYAAENGVGYIFIVSVNGFSGDVKVIVGIDPDGRIMRSSTLQHTETKGIGTIIDQDSFTGRFEGKDSNLEGISAVTGATISTNAYIHAAREAFAAFEVVNSGR